MDTASIIARAGGVSAVAKALGLDHSSVSKWQARGLPPGRVVAMHRLSGLPLDVVEAASVAGGHTIAPGGEAASSNAMSHHAPANAAE